jgi:Zn-finger nucleic acid-binding protein
MSRARRHRSRATVEAGDDHRPRFSSNLVGFHCALMVRGSLSDGLPTRLRMEKSAKPEVEAFNCPNCGAAVAPDSPSCCYCGSAIALRVCPSCFGAVSVGMRHCPHCGAEVMHGKPEKTSELRCPRCETNLARVAVGKHFLHECGRCGGLWVDKGSFQDICTQEEEQEAVLGFRHEPESRPLMQGRAPGRRAYIPCPECGKLMNQKNFSGCSGIVLDWCRDHGSWFDRRELQQIVAFIRDGGLRKAREREQSRLQEEEDRLRMQEFQSAALGRRLDTDLGRLELQHGRDPFLQFLSQMFR